MHQDAKQFTFLELPGGWNVLSEGKYGCCGILSARFIMSYLPH